MRSTIDLENALDSKLRSAARAKGLTLKAALNQVVAAGLYILTGEKCSRGQHKKKFKVQARACGFRPGVDLARLGVVLDEIELEDIAYKASDDHP